MSKLTSEQYVALLGMIQERFEISDAEMMSALVGILTAMCQKHGVDVIEYIQGFRS